MTLLMIFEGTAPAPMPKAGAPAGLKLNADNRTSQSPWGKKLPHFSDRLRVDPVPSPDDTSSRLILFVFVAFTVPDVSSITPSNLYEFEPLPQFPAYAKVAVLIESGGVDGHV